MHYTDCNQIIDSINQPKKGLSIRVDGQIGSDALPSFSGENESHTVKDVPGESHQWKDVPGESLYSHFVQALTTHCIFYINAKYKNTESSQSHQKSPQKLTA